MRFEDIINVDAYNAYVAKEVEKLKAEHARLNSSTSGGFGGGVAAPTTGLFGGVTPRTFSPPRTFSLFGGGVAAPTTGLFGGGVAAPTSGGFGGGVAAPTSGGFGGGIAALTSGGFGGGIAALTSGGGIAAPTTGLFGTPIAVAPSSDSVRSPAPSSDVGIPPESEAKPANVESCVEEESSPEEMAKIRDYKVHMFDYDVFHKDMIHYHSQQELNLGILSSKIQVCLQYLINHPILFEYNAVKGNAIMTELHRQMLRCVSHISYFATNTHNQKNDILSGMTNISSFSESIQKLEKLRLSVVNIATPLLAAAKPLKQEHTKKAVNAADSVEQSSIKKARTE